jgi:hypothetical protein
MVSVMHQTIQSRIGHYRIREQRDPILRWSITGDDHRRFEMTLSDNLVEILCLGGGQSREAKVIDDQYVRGQVFPYAFLPGVISPTGHEEPEELGCFGEEDFISQPTGLMPQGLSDVTLSYSGGSIKQDMFFFLDEAAVAEIPYQFRIEFGVKREVETLQRLFFFERGS